MNRKITITIEKKWNDNDTFCEVAAFALKEHVRYIEDHLDEKESFGCNEEFLLDAKGEMKTVNLCSLKWKHERITDE